jgi:hypothetical protein
MKFRQKDLGILFTVFNRSSHKYLSKFGWSFRKNQYLKIIGWENIYETNQPKGDILRDGALVIIPEGLIPHVYQKGLAAFEKEKERVYLVLHESNPDKKLDESRIRDIFQGKLQYPIRESRSTSGEFYNYFTQLSHAFSNSQEDFPSRLKGFFDFFPENPKNLQELKLQLLLDYNRPEDYKAFLDGHIPDKGLAAAVQNWLTKKRFKEILYQLAHCDPVEVIDHKMKLRNFFFPPSQ